MIKTRNQFVDWPMREGEQIDARAQASLYEARGEFQLIVDAVRHAGKGDAFAAFMRLKEKLMKEGLFEAEHKKPLPEYPRKIGIVTSPQAAALHDAVITLGRRWPSAQIILYPCSVQGAFAPAQIVSAIEDANKRAEVDVLLVIRGGGSLEDLQAFNTEEVARAIFASALPVISGIGHETDFSIADFVADLRAATPTAAAEAATPDRRDLHIRLDRAHHQLKESLQEQIFKTAQKLDDINRRIQHPAEALQIKLENTQQLAKRIQTLLKQHLSQAEATFALNKRQLKSLTPKPSALIERCNHASSRLNTSLMNQLGIRFQMMSALKQNLDLLCPTHVLQRGYSIVRTKKGKVVRSAKDVSLGDQIFIELAKDRLTAEVLMKDL
jgi:exodeoxyribonuclease VII large subunit